MALIVEDGTGVTGADSYGAEATADTYHTDHGNSTAWETPVAGAPSKEVSLRLGTQFLDATFGGKWRGVKKTLTQGLDWPRISAWDDDEDYIDDASIPQVLEYATYELALKVRQGDTLVADLTSPGVITEKTVGAGKVRQTIKYSGGSQHKAYSLVKRLVRELIEPGRIMRA